ncbi:MAG: sialidase family protein [Burkholderiales bacterium]
MQKSSNRFQMPGCNDDTMRDESTMRLFPKLTEIQLRVAALVLTVVIFASAWITHPDHDWSPFSLPAPMTVSGSSNEPPVFESRFISSSIDDVAHSASLAPLPDGGLIAAWFAGSREGSPSVVIRGARYDPVKKEWGAEFTFVDRALTQRSVRRHIRKLGNPVIAMAPDDRLWLFYVSVSVGGWAMSSINAMYSDDFGQSWSAPRRLITSPFFNLSTLVRSAPLFHRDGSMGLPVYHEFIGKFAEYLYLDRDGRIKDKLRISRGRDAIQATLVPLSETAAVAMLRYASGTAGNVLFSRTADAGRTWSAPQPAPLNNQDSSLAAVALGKSGGGILVALNNLPLGRFRLSLFHTDPELRGWRELAILDESPDAHGNLIEPARYKALLMEKFLRTGGSRHREMVDEFLQHLDHRMCRHAAGCEFEYEYPFFLRAADGRFHLAYTWNNSFIKHVVFNRAWLESRQ